MASPGKEGQKRDTSESFRKLIGETMDESMVSSAARGEFASDKLLKAGLGSLRSR